MIGFIGHSFTITVDCNSSHIELLLHDVCLANISLSRNGLYYNLDLSS
jgi:hypothetical protein